MRSYDLTQMRNVIFSLICVDDLLSKCAQGGIWTKSVCSGAGAD